MIAAEINRLVKSRGMRYRDIAVITGDLSVYRGEFAHQFEAGQIPYFIDSKKSILENPATELVRAALEVLEKDFSYESVFRYLKSGFLLEDETWLCRLENYVLALGIRGYRRWSSVWERTYPEAELMNLVKLNEVREQVVRPFAALKEVFGKRGTSVREKTRRPFWPSWKRSAWRRSSMSARRSCGTGEMRFWPPNMIRYTGLSRIFWPAQRPFWEKSGSPAGSIPIFWMRDSRRSRSG